MQQNLLVRASSAGFLFLAVFGTSLATTGSPFHMRAIYAFSLFAGILGITVLVGSVADIWKKRKTLSVWFLATMIVFDYLTALGIDKKDFLLPHLWESVWPWFLYVEGVGFLFGLALLHALLTTGLAKFMKRPQ